MKRTGSSGCGGSGLKEKVACGGVYETEFLSPGVPKNRPLSLMLRVFAQLSGVSDPCESMRSIV